MKPWVRNTSLSTASRAFRAGLGFASTIAESSRVRSFWFGSATAARQSRASSQCVGRPLWLRKAAPSALDISSPCACTRSEEHTSEIQSLMRISYAVFCLKKNNNTKKCYSRQDITEIQIITHTLHEQKHRIKTDNERNTE